MRRTLRLFLCLALCIVLCACEAGFERDAGGFGYTNNKTDIHYTVLSSQYEAACLGEQVGTYTNDAGSITKAFYQIPDLDEALYLTDDYAAVYCAAAVLPDAAQWELEAILVCDEDAVSVVTSTLRDAATLAAVKTLWFEGELTELPMERASFKKRLKMRCAAYPNLYYCVSFFAYESGEAYLFDSEGERAVLCDAQVIAAVMGK